MKKILLVIAIIVCSLNLLAQKDSVSKKDTSTYFLTGRIDDFKLLYAAIVQPGDVTPNQLKAIEEWIRTRLQKLNPPSKK